MSPARLCCPFVFIACCGLLLTKTADSYGAGVSQPITGFSTNQGFGNNFVSASSSAFGSGSVSATGLASTLAGLSQEQIDSQIATLRHGDSISINNVDYVALRSSNDGQSGRLNTMILVEAKGHQVGDSRTGDPYANSRVRDDSYSSAVPFGASRDVVAAGHSYSAPSINRQAIIGDGAAGSYSAPSVNRQNAVAVAVNSGAGVNDPSAISYSSQPASNAVRQSVAERDRPSYSSASDNSRSRPQNNVDHHDDKWDYADSVPGIAGQDYPILSQVGPSSFNCNGRREGGYYADIDSGCQVYHVCALNKKFSFLCPNGTVFDQKVFVCNWWYNVDCASSANYFNLNDQIGVAPIQVQPSIVEKPQPFYGPPPVQPALFEKPPKPTYGPPPPKVQAVVVEPVINRPSYGLEPPAIQANVASSAY